MRIHQDLTFTEIGVRLYTDVSRPFAILNLTGAGNAGAIFVDSTADCDELIRAVTKARDLLTGAASEPQETDDYAALYPDEQQPGTDAP